MRAYIIKKKGKLNRFNMFYDKETTFTDNTKINTGILFFKKKDAELYLNIFKHKEDYEVVGVTIEKPLTSKLVSVNRKEGYYIPNIRLYFKLKKLFKKRLE